MIAFFQRHPYLVRSAYRRGYERLNPLFFDTVHVNEFPKSGGTWLCRMLSSSLGWRLDDNSYPKPGKAVIKHHRIRFALPRTITVVRDPRDVAVSYYHHCRQIFQGDGFNQHIVKLMQQRVFDGCTSQSQEISAFAKMMVENPISPGFSWGQFYRAPDREGTVFIRYEDMRQDPGGSLETLLRALDLPVNAERIAAVVDQNDITKILSKRKPTDGAHFVRKGKVGGWQEELDPASARLIEQDAGALLERFGYS